MVEFLDTVQVSSGAAGGPVHGLEFGHGGLGEVEAVAGFPLVVLLDENRAGKAQEGYRVGKAPPGP